MPTQAYSQAIQLYRQGKLAEAAGLLERDGSLRTDPDSLQLLGSIKFQLGSVEEGRNLVESAIGIDSGHADAWISLGLIRHLTDDNGGALAAFDRVVDLAPRNGGAWLNRGFVLQQLSRQEEAVESLRKAIDLGIRDPNAYFFLGNSYAALGRQGDALMEFERSLSLDRTNPDAWNNYGNALLAVGRLREGEQALRRSLALDPSSRIAKVNLATALSHMRRSEEALKLLDSVLERSPDLVEAARAKADALIELDRLDDAAALLESVLQRRPEETAAVASLARVLRNQGLWRESLSVLAGESQPAQRLLSAVTLPVILESADTVIEAREHMARGLEEIEGEIRNPLSEVGSTTFYLAYHGVGERALQEKVAHTYRRVSPILRFESGHTPSEKGRIKLGVLSAHLHNHTIGKLFGRLFQRLDRDRFEVTFLQLGRTDEVSQRIAASADYHIHLATSLPDAMEQTAARKLDILVFPDVGMDVQSYYMAFGRYAAAQCAMWGHPMTTGSPAVDCFVSSDHLETPEGDDEYSERLVRLKSLTTFFERPSLPPPLTRADFGLPDGPRLYACLQTTFKFHPDFDRVLGKILERDGNALLLMIDPKTRQWRDLLVARWHKSCPHLAERTIFVPGMQLERYLALSALSDCVLDPIQFGGGNSTLECFAVGAPVVTLPQGLLRNRITYAAYRQIGFEDLIAMNEEEYVGLALRLANDREWQREMRATLYERSEPLYESVAALCEFEDFLAGLRP